MTNLRFNLAHFFNGAWALFGDLSSQLSRLIFLMIFVRIFDKDLVGEFQYCISIVAFLSIFSLPGMGEAVLQSEARGYCGTFRQTNKWQFSSSILGAIFLIVFACFSDLPSYSRGMLIAASILFPFSNGLAGWLNVELGNGNFKGRSLNQSLVNLIGYSLAIIYILIGQREFYWLIILINLPSSLSNTYNTIRCLTKIPSRAKPEKQSIIYGLKISAWSTLNIIGNNIDKLLLAIFMSPSGLALFVLAERIPEILKKYIQSGRSVLLPTLAKKKYYTSSLHRKFLLISAALSCLILVFSVLLLPFLFPLLFTSSYSEAIFYSQLLCGTLIIGQLAQTQVSFIKSRFDPSSTKNIVLISNLVKIISSALLIPQFSIYGAILSTACYRTATAITVSLMVRKHYVNA